ncbi:MAG: carbamoyl-phosphate synthase large subunit, partial [Eubacteriales bacterium]|nr:carbamoyl-phosphate synthase large subunit [Eubacteriales bacterium]
DLVRISTGMDFVRMVVDTACGNAPDLTPADEPARAEIRFVFTRADLEAYRRTAAEHPERLWRASEMAEIHEGAVTDSSTRFGYYILKG